MRCWSIGGELLGRDGVGTSDVDGQTRDLHGLIVYQTNDGRDLKCSKAIDTSMNTADIGTKHMSGTTRRRWLALLVPLVHAQGQDDRKMQVGGFNMKRRHSGRRTSGLWSDEILGDQKHLLWCPQLTHRPRVRRSAVCRRAGRRDVGDATLERTVTYDTVETCDVHTLCRTLIG